MNTFNIKSGLVVIAMSVSISGWAAFPCMPIAQACMKAGYHKGGNKEGKGLVKDCVLPVCMKTKTLDGVTFSDEALDACKNSLMEKANKMGKMKAMESNKSMEPMQEMPK